MSETLNLFFLALLGSIIALLGGVIFLFKESWSKFLSQNSVPFAAGVLITVSILGLLPESVDLLGEGTFIIVLVTFFAAYLFENLFFEVHHHATHEHPRSYKSAVPLVIVGDTIHNFIDGVAIGASFLVNPGLGLITAISTFLHEVPHEIGDFGILLKAAWKKRDIIVINVISASATIVGAFTLFLFPENETLLGTLLAISAGMFLYLGASDFLPHIEKPEGGKVRAILPLVIGVVIMVATLMAIPHSHEETEEGNRELPGVAAEN